MRGFARSVYQIQTPDEVERLARCLAQNFANSKSTRLGLHELLMNAVEHGNLGLGFDAKAACLHEGTWSEEINRRLALPQNRDKKVRVTFLRGAKFCCFNVADEGNGFSWEKRLQSIDLKSSRPNGRGLALAFRCGFAALSFNAKGNEVSGFAGLS